MTVEQLYATLSTSALLDLRAAFVADRAGIDTDAGRAFVDHRLALIRRELQKREVPE